MSSEPIERDVRPSPAHYDAAERHGWKIMGWATHDYPNRRSMTLLELVGSDGHDKHAFCHVPTTGSVEEWERIMGAAAIAEVVRRARI